MSIFIVLDVQHTH